MIFLKLHECARLPDARAQAALADMSVRAGASREAVNGSHERRRIECTSSSDFLADRGKWLEMAAAAGDEQAQLLYASVPEAVLGGSAQMLKDPEKTVQYKATALRYLNDLASRGSTDAMMRLAGAYEGGIIVAPDPVKAYAYYLVVDRAKPGVISSYLMDSQLAKVPPGRVGEARDLARRIYASCCSN
ncbi:sel1 repeat family protein [Lysobacter silvisoli]|uniref:sel1 repeat family protein n=1 Tax=Lysobacter silvisoli TaxID=2293254 RepID=UPI0011C03D70|nr:sel1 repeat family protein [Lysobacter silvisoli]